MKEFLFELIIAIVSASVPLIILYAVNAIKNIVAKRVENEAVQEKLNQITDLIFQAVARTAQTYVDSLKASGSFDESAQKKAFSDTKETIMELLNNDCKDLIEDLYQDLDAWIEVQIEAAVRNLKNQ